MPVLTGAVSAVLPFSHRMSVSGRVSETCTYEYGSGSIWLAAAALRSAFHEASASWFTVSSSAV